MINFNNIISLVGKNILITGASSGIGRVCAIHASQLGATVILIGQNEERLKDTYQQMEPGNHIYIIQNIREFARIESMISDCVMKIGKISGFIHSAGIESTIPLQGLNNRIYDEMFSINVIAAFEIARIISKNKNIDPNGGSFVFISSVMARLGQLGKIAYCSSKSALVGGARAIALELSSKRIRVNCILPGIVRTEMTEKLFSTIPESSKEEIIRKHPLGIGQPRDISNLSMFLLSDMSPWITASEIVIDGGYSAQ